METRNPAPAVPCGVGEDGETARALTASLTATGRLDANEATFVVHAQPTPIDMRQASRGEKMTNNRAPGSSGGAPGTGIGQPGDPCPTLSTSHPPAIAVSPLPFDTTQITSAANRSNPRPGDPCHPLAATAHPPAIAFSCKDHGAGGQVAVAFQERGREGGRSLEVGGEVAYALMAKGTNGGRSQEGNVLQGMSVRRITPREAERLQGFPDDYTLIPGKWRIRKPDDRAETIAYLLDSGYTLPESEALADCPDGPRYHALGDSWATTVARWIGERIDLVDAVRTLATV